MDPPSELRIDALHTPTPNLADEPTLADGPPSESSIDALNTATPNLADEPTLANGPPKCWHLVVHNGNFTLLQTSTGQEWIFHTATDI